MKQGVPQRMQGTAQLRLLKRGRAFRLLELLLQAWLAAVTTPHHSCPPCLRQLRWSAAWQEHRRIKIQQHIRMQTFSPSLLLLLLPPLVPLAVSLSANPHPDQIS